MATWHASLAFNCATAYSDDAAFDLMEALTNYGASMSIALDHMSGTITITVDAATPLEAASTATKLLHRHAPTTVGNVTDAGIEILSEEAMDAYLNEPAFPAVVGFAEIAELGGFSRQRARQLATSEAFPAAVITTAQGPLYSKHAIERYLETRTAKPGRPAKAHT